MVDLLTYLVLLLIVGLINYLNDRFVLRKEVRKLERSYKEKIALLDSQREDLRQLVALLRSHLIQSERVLRAVERIEELDKTY